MIERYVPAAWLPDLWSRRRAQAAPAAVASTRPLPAAGLSTGRASAVPWGEADIVLALLWAAALIVAGIAVMLAIRLLVWAPFRLGEALHLLSGGSVSRLLSPVHPYLVAAMSLLLGSLLYGSVVYGVYRRSVRRYHLAWSALGLRHAGWRTYGKVAALFVPITLGGLVVTHLELLLLGSRVQSTQGADLTRGVTPSPANVVMLFLLLAVITPIGEEIFFRGFLYRMLRGRLPVWAAAVVSATAFGVMHGSPALFPWLFFLGVVLALVVERTNSLYCSIILHGMTNALATLSIVVALTAS